MANQSTPTSDANERYNPINRVETRSQRFAELLVIGGAVAGFALSNGRLGIIAGLVLLGCWMRLQVELTFIVGAVLVAVLGGDVSTPGSLLTVAGLGGLLAVDLARAWASVQPAALFLMSVFAGALVGVPTYDRFGPYWFVLGAVGILAGGLYGLYRYQEYRSRYAVDDETRGRATGRRSTARSSTTDQRPDLND